MLTVEEIANMLDAKKLDYIASDKGIAVIAEDRDHYVVLGLCNIGYFSASSVDNKFTYVKNNEFKSLLNEEVISNKCNSNMETNKCAKYMSMQNLIEQKLGINKK